MDDAFQRTTSLREVTIPTTVRHIGFQAFMCSDLNAVTMKAGLIVIEHQAFNYRNFNWHTNFPHNDLLIELSAANGHLFWYVDKERTFSKRINTGMTATTLISPVY